MANHPNYELFEELGRGENSVVFRAWDIALSRDVAIKELKSDPGSDGGKADANRVKQFLKEASFLAQFEHQHVLRIHTVDQDRAWIVMELMKGSLASQIESKPMPADTVRSVLRQMLTALDFLHQKNKVHGAVRPSNILINENGIVKLSDFEASSLDGELPVPKGSKKYLAPELIQSDFGEFGPAVDLYCLGFTALELLTGKNFDSLFPGTGEGAINADVAWLRWHSSDETMKPVAELAPKVPADLAKVIDLLVQKPVAARPQDAAAVLELLNETPLIQVEVPKTNHSTARKDDVRAILPSSAVQLKEAKTRKKPVANKAKSAAKSKPKSGLNEKLGKPYVLWPICVAILATAFFVGLQLRGDREEVAQGGESAQPNPVLPVTPQPTDDDPSPEKPQTPTALGVELRVLPNANGAKLLVNGEPHDFDDLKLFAGSHDIVIKKEGFETFSSAIAIDEDHRAFDVTLNEIPIEIPFEIPFERPIEPTVEKIPPTKIANSIPLPSSLVPQPGTTHDETTGLPIRVLAVALQGRAPLELALVTAGTYSFGVPDGDLRTWELPANTIEIKDPFYIGINEVTQAQFGEFMAENSTQPDPQKQVGLNLPAANMPVQKAAAFCDWIGGRLPTEQEWEAAARGTDDLGYPLPWASSDLTEAHCRLFCGESKNENMAVAVNATPLGVSAIGLLNTIGNVAEWTDNQLSGDQFVIKGCSYRIPPGDHVRITWRNQSRFSGSPDVGFRAMVPVVKHSRPSQALSFVEPTNIDSLFVNTGIDDENKAQPVVDTKTVSELASEFSGPAELVIDSGGFMGEISDVCFSPDGRKIAVAGGKVVRIWDAETGRLTNTLRGDMSRTSYGNVNAVAWSPDGKYLVIGVNDYRDHGNIRVYSTDDFDTISEVIAGHEAPCRKLCFSRDGKFLVSVDSDGMVIVRDWNSKQIKHRIPARDRDQPIYDVMKFATNEPVLIGVDFEGPQVLSAETGQKLNAADAMPANVRGWLIDVFNKLVRYPYGVTVPPRVLDFRMEDGFWAGAGNATVNGRSKFWIRIWESREPVTAAIPAKEIAAYDQHRWQVTAISLQPGGTLVASADKFGEVHVWDSTTGKRKFKFTGQGKPIYEVAFDQGSSRLAFGLTPHKPSVWNRNNHGDATRVLDLKLRAITDAKSRDGLDLINEQPTIGDLNVDVRKQDAYYYIQRKRGSQLLSKYRVSSGRNPTVYTLLDQPKLDVEEPVIFGDNEGLLALWDSETDELKRAFIGHGGLVSGVSASPNGKLIASSSTDRTIRLWSLENHKATGIFDFKYENSAVRKVIPGTSSAKAGVKVGDKIVSIDGKSMTEMLELMLVGKFECQPGETVPVTLSRDGEPFTYQMTLATGYDFAEPILSFYMGNDGQWIIWHPQGYYDASPGADKLIGWHVNRGYDKSAKFFQVQQFRDTLYRPDVIDGILETGSLQEALAKLNSPGKRKDQKEIDFGLPEVIAEYHPPSVKITSPTDSWQTDSSQVTVTGEATSVNGLPLTALTLLHNGNVAKVFRPTKVNQLRMEISYDMQLAPGANDLVLIAANAKSSSQGEHIVVNLNQPTRQDLPNAIVLAIGVSEFDDSLNPLPSAASDAMAFEQAMMSHQNGRLYQNIKTKLVSGRVEDNEILNGFEWLADNTQQGDVAIVFVASHGVVDRRDNFYIGSSNTVESKARSTAVSWRDLLDTLQLDLPDCKRMVFLDLEPTKNSIRPGLRNPLLDLAAPEMGTIFLSSNTLQQPSVKIANSGKSAFMRAVMETVGDRKNDTNPGDSMFNPMELAAGVTQRVKDFTRDQQQPVFFTPEFAKRANVLELQN